MNWALAAVAVGGALGATSRFGVGRLLAAHPGRYATLAVNVAGSFALGVVVFGGLDSTAALLFGTGFCGAFTTFSSFSVQTVDLWRDGRRAASAVNAVGSVVLAGGAMLAARLAVG
ncbi:MAG: CrcB family protein [Haloferacaceae archaeon]